MFDLIFNFFRREVKFNFDTLGGSGEVFPSIVKPINAWARNPELSNPAEI